MAKTELQQLRKCIDEIDSLFSQYTFPDFTDEEKVDEDIQKRIDQNTILKKIVNVADKGLKRFPAHPTLLAKKALASTMIINEDLEFPDSFAAYKAIDTYLRSDENNIDIQLAYAQILYSANLLGQEQLIEPIDKMIASVQSSLSIMVATKIRVLGHMGEYEQIKKLFKKWKRHFHDNDLHILQDAYNRAMKYANE